MFLIVLHHNAVHALYPEILNYESTYIDSTIMLYFHSILFIGVNLFVLISGYFGIKTNVRSFFKLYVYVAVYAFISSFIREIYVTMQNIGSLDSYNVYAVIRNTIFPFSNSKLWFIQVYVALFLLAPLLQVTIQALSKIQYIQALVILTIVNVYLGYYVGVEDINADGYTLANFIYLYFIGAYTSRYTNLQSEKTKKRRYWMATFFLCVIGWGFVTYIAHLRGGRGIDGSTAAYLRSFTYNNPFIIVMAVSLFCFIMSYDFKSKIINWLASSCLAVYMVQESIVPYHWLTDIAIDVVSPLVRIVLWLSYSTVFYFLILLLDKVRMVCTNPIITLYDRCMVKIANDSKYKKIKRFFDRLTLKF